MPTVTVNAEEALAAVQDQETDQPVANQAPSGETSSGEELILGKFKDHAALEEAYKNLESKLGEQGGEPTPAANDGDTPADEPEGLEITREEEQPAEAALDFDKYTAEFTEKGDLTPESRAEIKDKLNLPDTMIDAYLAGLKAQQAETLRTVEAAAFEAAGGKDSFSAIAQWAQNPASGVTDAELDAYNETIKSGNPAQISLAVAGLKARYSAANGTEASLVGGSGGAPTTVGFESQQELVAAMSDPRYNKDPAYRREVERKLAASRNL